MQPIKTSVRTVKWVTGVGGGGFNQNIQKKKRTVNVCRARSNRNGSLTHGSSFDLSRTATFLLVVTNHERISFAITATTAVTTILISSCLSTVISQNTALPLRAANFLLQTNHFDFISQPGAGLKSQFPSTGWSVTRTACFAPLNSTS